MTDGQMLYQISGFIDTDKIHPNACPALVADLSTGEQGIIALAFGKFCSLCKSFKIFNDMLDSEFFFIILFELFLICFRFSLFLFSLSWGCVFKVIHDCSSQINR